MNSIIKQIKELKNIKPSKEWKEETGKEFILRAERLFPVQEKAGFLFSFKTYFRFHYLVRATVMAALVLLLGFGGSIFTVQATKNTLPGDLLYGLKIIKERVHIAITSGSDKRVSLKLSFADNRLTEANQLMDKIEKEPEKDGQRMAQVMDNFQKDIEEAEKHLLELKEESLTEDKEKIKETVEEVNSKTEEYDIVLTELKEKPFLEQGIADKIEIAILSSRKLAETAQEPLKQEPQEKEKQEEIKEDTILTVPQEIKGEVGEIIVSDTEGLESETIIIIKEELQEKKEEEKIEEQKPVLPIQKQEVEKPKEEVKQDFQGGLKREEIKFRGLMTRD